MRPVYIYGLCDPATGQIRYVGKTVDLEKRYILHLSRARRKHTPHVYAWIRSLLKRGTPPAVQVLAVVGEEQWEEMERLFIDGTEGLTNMAPGGEGVPPELISKAKAGTYIVTHPDGTEEVVTNLSKFCESRGIPNSNAFKVISGKRHHAHGYKFRNVGEPPRERKPKYRAVYPDGTVEEFHVIKAWAEERGYNVQSIRAVSAGQKPHYRGIKVSKISEARKKERMVQA